MARGGDVIPPRRPVPAFLPPLPLALAIAVAWLYALSSLQRLAAFAVRQEVGSDFLYNLLAARIGLEQGWAAVYDVARYGEVTHRGGPLAYANLPAIAWLAAPLTGLPFELALLLWMVPLVILLLAAWWLAAPGGAWQRAAHLAVLLSATPVFVALGLGQFTLAVVGLVAIHWWLLRRGRPVLAGVALALACLKPQAVFLVPAALALCGRWRCLAAWAATAAALAVATAVALGQDGVAAYRHHLDHAFDAISTASTPWRYLPEWLPAQPLRLAVAALALVPAASDGARRPGRAIAAALLGSMLVTPYLNRQDLALLVLAGWLVLGEGAPGWARWALLASLVALDFPASPVPTIVAEGFWLFALPLLALVPWLVAAPPVVGQTGETR